jgi:murein DD-endopeptidase MepM/ murein hydrolase activator NlpD
MSARSFITSLIIVALFIVSAPVPYSFVSAQTADQLKGNLDTLSAQIKSLDDEIKAYSTKISKTQGEAKTLKEALSRLETRRVGLAKDIAYTKLRITQAEQNINFTQGKISNTESTLEKTKAGLAESFRTYAYSEQSLPHFVSALAEGAYLSDALDVTKRGGELTSAINQKTRSLVDVKTTLSIQKANFEQHKNVLLTLNQTLTGQKQLVDQTSKNKSDLLSETKNKETAYQQLVSERKKKKGQLEAEMSDIEAKLQTIVDSSKIPKHGKGILKYPLDNVIITQYFGNTPFSSKNPQVYNGSGHNGIDFGIKVGTPIYSAAAGTVLGTGDTDASCNGVSYGKWVLVKHNNGLTSLYAHLSVIQVKAGDTMTSRQQVGLSGNTGYSTGPHLHFTVYASDAVQITNYVSKVCGTNMRMPIAPRAGYLNPLSYL